MFVGLALAPGGSTGSEATRPIGLVPGSVFAAVRNDLVELAKSNPISCVEAPADRSFSAVSLVFPSCFFAVSFPFLFA